MTSPVWDIQIILEIKIVVFKPSRLLKLKEWSLKSDRIQIWPLILFLIWNHDNCICCGCLLVSPGNFQLSSEGEVLKLHNEEEANCLERLMRDPLRPFVPEFHGTVTRGEHCYIRMEDLLSGLRKPVIMDCKMGVR